MEEKKETKRLGQIRQESIVVVGVGAALRRASSFEAVWGKRKVDCERPSEG